MTASNGRTETGRPLILYEARSELAARLAALRQFLAFLALLYCFQKSMCSQSLKAAFATCILNVYNERVINLQEGSINA